MAHNVIDNLRSGLELHFGQIAETRHNGGHRVFALEHSLTGEQLNELIGYLNASLSRGENQDANWLLWCVTAAECGYEYVGDEYWDSFSDYIPCWGFHDRHRIPNWFRRFRDEYFGVSPSGRWASHFRIIAWPIAHAVLPRYLQRHLAKTLYDLRFHLADAEYLHGRELGQFVQTHSVPGHTRYDRFLQDHELVGRIVEALLSSEAPGSSQTIYGPTLARIVSDLEGIRQAKEWLHETRSVVQDRIIGIKRALTTDGSCTALKTRPEAFGRRPRLYLRHIGDDNWSVYLALPGLAKLARTDDHLLEYLRVHRCRLAGVDGIRPRGWLLGPDRYAQLQTWPQPNSHLVHFEGAEMQVPEVFSDWQLQDRRFYLFRVADDGRAIGIDSLVVHPDTTYMLVSTSAIEEIAKWATPTSILVDGVVAQRLDIPAIVSTELELDLTRAGLRLIRTTQVTAVGVPDCDAEDGELQEWLTTDSPTFALFSDHHVDEVQIRLNEALEPCVISAQGKQLVYFKLDPLPVGRHILEICTRRDTASIEEKRDVTEVFEFRVRKPGVWMPGSGHPAGVNVEYAPIDATLDDLWTNKIEVAITGPSEFVDIHAVLFDERGDVIFKAKVVDHASLPISPSDWRRYFRRFVETNGAEWRYLDAFCGQIEVDAGNLGGRKVRFEHDFQPLRLLVRERGDMMSVRLFDDSGLCDETGTISSWSMERPDKYETISWERLMGGLVVPQPGALYVAERANYRDSVVVSGGVPKEGLRGLGVKPHLDRRALSSQPIAQQFMHYCAWRCSRAIGPLAEVRQEQVSNRLLEQIYFQTCGGHWVNAERNARQNDSKDVITKLEDLVDKQRGFAIVLSRDFPSAVDNGISIEDWFIATAQAFKLVEEPALARFGLLLAFHPRQLRAESPESLARSFDLIQRQPAILRGARLIKYLDELSGDQGKLLLEEPLWQYMS